MKYLVLFENFDPFAHLEPSDVLPVDKKENCVLGFTLRGNDKIRNPYLSLPAGFTCPNADKCKTMAIKDPITGRVKLKDFGEFRCYAASDEVKYPNLYDRNWSNLNLIQSQETKEGIIKLLEKSFLQSKIFRCLGRLREKTHRNNFLCLYHKSKFLGKKIE
jgi:hypothetical protein